MACRESRQMSANLLVDRVSVLRLRSPRGEQIVKVITPAWCPKVGDITENFQYNLSGCIRTELVIDFADRPKDLIPVPAPRQVVGGRVAFDDRIAERGQCIRK